jgi:hypothetical protein
MLAGPGELTKAIPAELGAIQIQAFQDLSADGPTDDDPFGWLDLVVGEEAPEALVLVLEKGGKLKHAKSMGHVGSSGAIEGPTVQLKMQVRSDFDRAVDLDFRGEAGLVYKAMLDGPGNHNIGVPSELGSIQLQAFQDLSGDGPSDDDPFGWVQVEIGTEEPDPVILILKAGAKLDLAAAMGHGAVGQAGQLEPFADFNGAWSLIRGEISGGAEGVVQVDFRVPDAEAAGGNRFLGRSVLPKAGSFQLQVPRNMGALILEVFQDPGNDGPSDDDSYASIELEIGDVDSVIHNIALEVGARGQPSEAAPGAEGPENGTPEQTVFADLGENPVLISGTLRLATGIEAIEFIDLDLFAPDDSAPGGRRYLGKLKHKVGAYSFSVPRDFGPLEIEAFGDPDRDGPTPGDPFGRYGANPLKVGSSPLSGVDILLNPS